MLAYLPASIYRSIEVRDAFKNELVDMKGAIAGYHGEVGVGALGEATARRSAGAYGEGA